jgi:hypothetical protein
MCAVAFSCVWLIVNFREFVGMFGLCGCFCVGDFVGGLWFMGFLGVFS